MEQSVTIKKNVDDSGNKTSHRMIYGEVEGDTQWAQFSEQFSGIHQDFLRALSTKFGSFTKSEIMLISLLKMNMNSKEITSILGRSDDGIRKARYRLWGKGPESTFRAFFQLSTFCPMAKLYTPYK